MSWKRPPFRVTTGTEELDLDLIHGFLTTSYWAAGISRDVVERSLAGSLCFGLFREQQQIGFARVVTDGSTFAWLADVFVVPTERGSGLGAWLVECVVSHPELAGLRRFLLATADAHELYRRFGFEPLASPEHWMSRPAQSSD